MQGNIFLGKIERARLGSVRVNNIVFVWAMVFIGMVVYAIAWFALGYAAFSIIEALSVSMATLLSGNSDATQVINLIKWLILLHPIFAMFGWIIWGFLNSARRDVQRYEV